MTSTNRSGTSRLTASSTAHSAARIAACDPSIPTTIGDCVVVESPIAVPLTSRVVELRTVGAVVWAAALFGDRYHATRMRTCGTASLSMSERMRSRVDADLGELRYRAGCQPDQRAFQQRRGKRFADGQRVGASVVVGGQEQDLGVVFGNFEASFGSTGDGEHPSDTDAVTLGRRDEGTVRDSLRCLEWRSPPVQFVMVGSVVEP